MGLSPRTPSGRSALPVTSTPPGRTDRKSTRLNSSHDQISYAVFCLKKKKKNRNTSNAKYKHDETPRDRQNRHVIYIPHSLPDPVSNQHQILHSLLPSRHLQDES